MSTLAEITVPYDELHDTLSENIDMGGLKAEKTFRVAWDDRIAFYQAVCGYVTVTGGVGGTITQRVPLQYPELPNLYASAIEMTPEGASRDGALQIAYDWAIIKVTFQTVPWNFSGADDPDSFTDGQWRTESIEMGGEILSFPAQAYKYQANPGVKVTQPVGRIVPTMNLTITQYQCAYIPYANIFTLIGNVNASTFYGADAGTMLFLGGQSEAETNIIGFRTQKLTYKFSYRSIPWNKFLLPTGNGFDTLVEQSSGNTVYPSGDFTPLFLS
jgi:hypothetical protein